MISTITTLKSKTKVELSALASLLKLTISGTKDELLARIAEHLCNNPKDIVLIPGHDVSDEENLQAIKDFVDLNKLKIPSTSMNPGSRPTSPLATQGNLFVSADVLQKLAAIQADQVVLMKDLQLGTASKSNYNKTDDRFLSRTRNLSKLWDGNSINAVDAYDFIEAFDECVQVYSPKIEIIKSALKDTLRGKALTWFLSKRNSITDFDSFKGEFLEVFTLRNRDKVIQNEIRSAKQKHNERIDDFLARLNVLNLKLKHRFTQDEILQFLIENSDSRYSLQFDLVSSVTEENILKVARFIEHAESKRLSFDKQNKPVRPSVAAVVTDDDSNHACTCVSTKLEVEAAPIVTGEIAATQKLFCFNCKDPSHFIDQCPHPITLKCQKCNTKGTSTFNCSKCKKPQITSGKVNLN